MIFKHSIVTTSTPNYRVLDTDYDSFSIVYNCNTVFGLFKTGETVRATVRAATEDLVTMTHWQRITNTFARLAKIFCQGMFVLSKH